jgi:ketosteroid isomerase-like protein
VSGRELVEQLFAAESSADVEGIVSLMHEEVVLHLSCRHLYEENAKTCFKGKMEVRSVYEQDIPLRGSGFRIEPERVIEQDDWVVAIWVVHRGSEGGIVRRGVDTFKIHEEQIIYGKVFLDLDTVPELNR